MKLNPRTGWLTKEEVAAIVKNHLEGRFKCKVKVSPSVDDAGNAVSVWDHENVNPVGKKPFDFKGFRFELQEESPNVH